jgi:hypothetical protein
MWKIQRIKKDKIEKKFQFHELFKIKQIIIKRS